MTAKKLFLYAAMAMILGAATNHALAADNSGSQNMPPLIDLKAEAKKQSQKDKNSSANSTEPHVEPSSEATGTKSGVGTTDNASSASNKTNGTNATTTKAAIAKTEKPLHWSYEGAEGPGHWGDLSPDFAKCKTGKNQSPINLMETKAIGTTGLAALDVIYRDSYLKILHTGHTVQVNYPLGSYIRLNGHRYELLQFHFHTPSEHQLNGFNYPMEMHLVHRDGQGHVAVIGIIFREGEENKALQGILKHLPAAPMKTPPVANKGAAKMHQKTENKEQIFRDVTVNPKDFFPENKQFFKYSGSLTTPPCSEGVYWMVFKHPIEASYEQIQQMNEAMGDNARPVQPLNARDLLKSWMDPSETGDEYEFYYQ